ncbi:hypothetical protein GCM10028791_37790 [Echinicola sediminis]
MEFTLASFKEMAKQLENLNSKLDKLLEQNIQENNSAVMSVEEAAKFLKLTKSTLYKKTSLNEIPYCKTGKVLVFFKHDLIEWLKSNRVAGVSELLKNKYSRF